MIFILLGDQPQNLLLRSEEWGDAAWDRLSALTVTDDDEPAPNGTTTAEKCEPSGANAFIGQNSVSVTANLIYTLSFYAKSVAGEEVISFAIRKDDLTLIGANESITVTAGWKRFQLSRDVGAETSITVMFGGGSTWSSGASEDIYCWGAQLNEGAVATPYVKTEGTAVL